MTDITAGNLRPTSLDERRRRPRRHTCDECTVSVLDGALAGQTFECVFREVSPMSASLLVRAELRPGQRVQLQSHHDGQPVGAPIPGEVTRSRPLTTGRYDVSVEYRVPAPAPKPSESQRRHERRQARIGGREAVIASPVSRSL